MSNNIIVFGGDGFCGWPTSLYLSNKGYDVTVVDNFSRRKIDIELGCESLTPIKSMENRINAWEELTGKNIDFVYADVADHYHRILSLLKEKKPIAVVHFAEQRAAPFSMKSPYYKRYTVYNNINVTHNILCAVVESGIDIHVVHLGTTGIYGYGTAGMAIPEGYLDVSVNTSLGKKDMSIIYPSNPGSIYHMTKCMDLEMFQYYNKNNKVRITDLEQGIVWGTQTKETVLDDRLINRFDYDGDYGTCLNRFMMQAAIGHPMTVHGTGGQTRAFINIADTTKCVRMAIESPPVNNDKVKVFNQTAECLNINELALKIQSLFGGEIRYYKNPRNEDIKNDLKFVNEGFRSLGWDPILLDDKLLEEIRFIAKRYRYRCDVSKIICRSLWNEENEIDLIGSTNPVL